MLINNGELVRVAGLVFHRGALDGLRETLRKFKAEHGPKMDVNAFKDLTGVSRKYAIPLLEYLDLQRVTKGHIELEVTRRIRLWDLYLTLDGAYHPVKSYVTASPLGTDPGLIEPLGASVMLKFTIGAAPHSLPSHPVEDQMRRRSDPDPPVQPFTQALLYGPAARARAEDATKDYIRQLQRAVEGQPKVKLDTWQKFLQGGLKQPAAQQGNPQ